MARKRHGWANPIGWREPITFREPIRWGHSTTKNRCGHRWHPISEDDLMAGNIAESEGPHYCDLNPDHMGGHMCKCGSEWHD